MGVFLSYLLIAIGVSYYQKLPVDQQLSDVSLEVGRIVRAFTRLGYTHVLQDLIANPTQDRMRRELSAWLREPSRSSEDVVVIYYTGHGAIEMGRHYLLTSDSAVNNLIGTAFPTDTIAYMLAGSPVQHLLVILDACYAGTGIGDLTAVAAELSGIRFVQETHGSGLWFVAAARPGDEAEQNVFVDALIRALETTKAGQRQRFIHPGEIIDSVNRDLMERGRRQRARYNVGDSSGLPPFFVNPRYDSLLPYGIDLETQRRLRERDRQEHFSPRSRGVEFESEPGWYFSGRDRILSTLVSWINEPQGDHHARVITGSPGCGKSAIIARLVMLSDDSYRRKVPLEHVLPSAVPPVGAVDVAVHLRNKHLEEVVATIAAGAGVEATDPVALVQALARRAEPLVVIVDGLDEAGRSTDSPYHHNAEPSRLARQLFKPLSGLPSVKLIIGTRPEVIPALGQSVKVIAVDRPNYVTAPEIAQYVHRILVAAGVPDKQTPFQQDLILTSRVADAVAERAYPNFLVARIVANNLLASNVTPSNYAMSKASKNFPEEVGDAFRDYLERFGPNEYRVRRLLMPLVYAEGSGLPWDNLWAPLAAAISGEFSSDMDIDWLLRNAGAYIVESIAKGRSVYRLHHQALADYLRRPQRDDDIQARITRTLLEQVPVSPIGGKRKWNLAHPYIRDHLATHAAAAGLLDELVSEPGFLLVSNPERLLQALDSLQSEQFDRHARAYRRAYSMLISRPAREHSSYLELAAHCAGAENLVSALRQIQDQRPWRLRWANWQQVGSYRILGSHHGGARDLTVGKVAGRVVAISGGWDNVVRIWDVSDGGQIVECFGHTNGVRAVATGEVNGVGAVVSGGADGTLRIWDLSTGAPLFPPVSAHDGDIRCIRGGRYRGTSIFASAGNDGRIRLWVPDATGASCLRLMEHGAWVNMVAFYESSGGTYVVSGGDDNLIRVWNVETGGLVATLKGHKGGVYALTTTRLGDRVIVVSGSWDYSIRFWDPELGVEIRPAITKHEGPVMTVAPATLDGRSVIASGGWDRSIRFWDIEMGHEVFAPLLGHDDGIMGLVDCDVEGRRLLLSASWDNTVRVWDRYPTKSKQVESRHTGNVVAVSAAADGRDDKIISGGRDGVLRTLSAVDGRLMGHVGVSPAGPVSSLHMKRFGDRLVAASGCWDGSIHIWDAHDLSHSRRSFQAHDGGICAVLLLEGAMTERSIVTASSDHTVRVWSLDTFQQQVEFLGHDGWVTSMEFLRTEDCAILVSGSADWTIRKWKLSSPTLIADPLVVCDSAILSLRGGRMKGRNIMAFGCEDGSVGMIYRPAEQEQRVLPVIRHEGAVTSVAITGDESAVSIVSASADHTVRVSRWTSHKFDMQDTEVIDLGCAIFDLDVVASDVIAVGTSMGLVCIDLKDYGMTDNRF
ncbi:caspase family protein [Streptosporangium sp. NPDC023825]|uniref:caspase family protein n=1 Tax=Streptosporangium sp. NPDC023825 TaxID=3154909 RepID=UPI00341D503C